MASGRVFEVERRRGKGERESGPLTFGAANYKPRH